MPRLQYQARAEVLSTSKEAVPVDKWAPQLPPMRRATRVITAAILAGSCFLGAPPAAQAVKYDAWAPKYVDRVNVRRVIPASIRAGSLFFTRPPSFAEYVTCDKWLPEYPDRIDECRPRSAPPSFFFVPRLVSTATDDFNRANESPLSNGTWSIPTGGSGLQLASNVLRAGAAATRVQYWSACSFSSDQWAELSVASTGTYQLGVAARVQPGEVTYYRYVWDVNSLELARYDAGTKTVLWTLSDSLTVGQRIRLEAIGSSFYMYVDGAQVGNYTDASPITGGAPGVAGSNSGPEGDDWSAGDWVPPVPVPSDSWEPILPDFWRGKPGLSRAQTALSVTTLHYPPPPETINVDKWAPRYPDLLRRRVQLPEHVRASGSFFVYKPPFIEIITMDKWTPVLPHNRRAKLRWLPVPILSDILFRCGLVIPNPAQQLSAAVILLRTQSMEIDVRQVGSVPVCEREGSISVELKMGSITIILSEA